MDSSPASDDERPSSVIVAEAEQDAGGPGRRARGCFRWQRPRAAGSAGSRFEGAWPYLQLIPAQPPRLRRLPVARTAAGRRGRAGARGARSLPHPLAARRGIAGIASRCGGGGCASTGLGSSSATRGWRRRGAASTGWVSTSIFEVGDTVSLQWDWACDRLSVHPRCRPGRRGCCCTE